MHVCLCAYVCVCGSTYACPRLYLCVPVLFANVCALLPCLRPYLCAPVCVCVPVPFASVCVSYCLGRLGEHSLCVLLVPERILFSCAVKVPPVSYHPFGALHRCCTSAHERAHTCTQTRTRTKQQHTHKTTTHTSINKQHTHRPASKTPAPLAAEVVLPPAAPCVRSSPAT